MNAKKLWISAEFKIIELHTQDIITGSPTPGGNVSPEDPYEGEMDGMSW